MQQLVIRPDWAHQISQVRHGLTEDTNIIGWGNTYYRCCKEGPPTELTVASADGRAKLDLSLRPSDLYITRVGVATEMGRYGSLTSTLAVSAPTLEHAIRSLSGGKVHGDEAFGLRSLVVFCVAEALRFDSLAHEIGFALRTVDVAGGAKPLQLQRWWPTVHAWGQACEAVWAGVDPEVRRASLLPNDARKGSDRTLWARANHDRLTGAVLAAARGAAVLKRPAV